MSRRLCLVLTLGVLLLPGVVAAFQLQPVLSGLSSPLLVTNAGDGSRRLFIVEQPGRIKVLGAGQTTATVFLDISDRVAFGGEQGLLGLAFHPLYRINGRFFVDYTRKSDGATVIAEYQRTGNGLTASRTERILLVIPQPYANHNGGMLAFGQDGFLYIGMGDGGSANDPQQRAQNVNELLGKILRIGVDGAMPYAIPTDNPYVGKTGRDEIFAIGLRNPFRFSFDRATGQLLVGDVGQGAWEEVDIVTRGANMGWRVMEGNHCTNLEPTCGPAGFTAPIAEYDHSLGRCSITGGYVYRGARKVFPTGTYVFGDYCTGEIFTLSGGVTTKVLDTTMNISSFGEDESGELYVVGLGGTLSRFVPDIATCFSRPLGRTADLDGNCTQDVIWHKPAGGAYNLWTMNGTTVTSRTDFTPGPGWTVVGTGDFNGDGKADIVGWSTGGQIAIWFMRGGIVTGSTVMNVGPAWDVAGVADFDGDGKPDILWHNKTAGRAVIWPMNGIQIKQAVNYVIGVGWTAAAVGDFDGDGKADIVWQRTGSSDVMIYFMDGVRVASTMQFIPGRRGESSGWWISTTTARPELLWRHSTSG